MKQISLLVLILITAGCCSTGTQNSSSDLQYIHKVERRLVTVDGKQTLETEVVRVPYVGK